MRIALRRSRMFDLSKSLRLWITFAGCVLVVAVLYCAQAVLMPLALAVLVSFVLGPLVARLQRRIGRVPAVLATVVLGFGALGLAGWGLGTQLAKLSVDLPGYRTNIRQKVEDIRRAGKASTVQKVQDTIDDIKTEIAKTADPQSEPEPVVVRPQPVVDAWSVPAWLGPVVAPLTTAGLVIAMVIFMLLNREDLRDRLIRLVGRGHLAVTTRALEEAGTRISRQLLMQSIVNLIYGFCVGLGLTVIGVPYAPLWGSLAAVTRFVPYVGAFIGSAIPTLVAIAALPGWKPALYVIGLFIGLEILTNLVLETVLYAEAAGISQVALLVSLAFWTWLWGPMGLLMAMPLTVCVVVIGKHVSGLEFLATLMTDTESLAPDASYYQRLLAHDPSEAWDIVERHVRTEAPGTVYDALLLPALNYAARDRLGDRLSAEEEAALVSATREMMHGMDAQPGAAHDDSRGVDRAKVLGCAASTDSDVAALEMLEQLLAPTDVRLDIRSGHLLPSDVIRTVKEEGYAVLCVADLPPGPSSRTRYLIKKLRSALPDVRIVVGRWAPPALADERAQDLLDAGADHVGTTLVSTRAELCELTRLVPAGRATVKSTASKPIASGRQTRVRP